MFTKQTQGVVNAMAAATPQSAQDMVQAMCNGAQSLEHRGEVTLTKCQLYSGNYPTTKPPPGRVNPVTAQLGFPPLDGLPQLKAGPWNIVSPGGSLPLDVPPRSQVRRMRSGEFTPWTPQATLAVGGGLSAGEASVSGPIVADSLTTTSITAKGNAITYGENRHRRNVHVGGNTVSLGHVANRGGMTVNGPLTTTGQTITRDYAYHFGPGHRYAPTWCFGPVRVGAATNVFHKGVAYRATSEEVVTRVWLDGNTLKVAKKRLHFLGFGRMPANKEVLTFTLGGASLDAETCEVVPDAGETPQITFVSGVAPPT